VEDWRKPLIDYLHNPSSSVDRKVRRWALKFVLDNGELYRRTVYDLLLKCLDPDQARLAMAEVHVGVLDRQTYQGGTRGSRLCGEDRDRETENSKVCARTRDTRFIQVRAAKVASPTSCLGIKYGAPRLVLG
jgi:hypothetical protein